MEIFERLSIFYMRALKKNFLSEINDKKRVSIFFP